ncbi:MAG: SHOCT domain-containing protein [Acidobacteria bacterium]|nr:SHOCT domain-containing protein [Acidobacteriota bacterium]
MEVERCEVANRQGTVLTVPAVAFLVAVLGAGVGALARRRRRRRHHGVAGSDEGRSDHGRPTGTIDADAFEILARRFASGELDEDEFRRRRSVLSELAR